MSKNNYEIDRENLAEYITHQFLERYRKQLINRFAFEGDEDFTLRKQRLFFHTAFKFPCIALDKPNKKAGLVIMRFVPEEWDLTGKPTKGTAFKAVPNSYLSSSKDLKTQYFKTLKNCVVFRYNDEEFGIGKSPQDIFNVKIAPLIKTLVFEFLSLSETHAPQLIFQKSDNQKENSTIQSLQDPKTKITYINKMTEKENENLPNEVEDQIKTKIGILKLQGDIKAFYEVMDDTFKWIDKLLGQRHDTTYKKGQSIQAEIRDGTADIFAFERHLLTLMEIFIEEYNETFNTELKLIDHLAGYIEVEKTNEFKAGEHLEAGSNVGGQND